MRSQFPRKTVTTTRRRGTAFSNASRQGSRLPGALVAFVRFLEDSGLVAADGAPVDTLLGVIDD